MREKPRKIEKRENLRESSNPRIYTSKNMSSSIGDSTVEEHIIPIYAASLPVPNVQEMVKENPSNVPNKYIRDKEDMPKSTDLTHLSSEIPIVDLTLLSSGDEIELKKFDSACKEWGFFQVANHGVEKEILHGIKNAASGFFDLPLKEKEKYSVSSNDIQGYGHAYVVFEEQKLDWSDTLILVTYPSKFRRLEYWPNTPQGFKDIIEAYSFEVKRVAEELLGSVSSIMGMEKNSILELHKDLIQALRVNYYPTCNKPDQVLGLSPHSDTSTITILLQDDDIDGLQIRHDGEWVPVKPIPNALLVNIGDVIEIWSNGKYKSIEHRAVTNENEARFSFAIFFFPGNDVEIEPFDHMVDSERSLMMYKKVKYGDYLRQSLNRRLQGKAHTQIAKKEI